MDSHGNVAEAQIGELIVTAPLAYGIEDIRLVFTSYRIIVNHLGKKSTSRVATAFFLGKLGPALERVFKTGQRKKVGLASPEEMLKMDPENFAIPYHEIVRLQVAGEPRRKLLLVTKDDKFEFEARAPIPFQLLSKLGAFLGSKLIQV